MQRRTVLKQLAFAGTVAGMGGGYLWLSADRDNSALSVAAMLRRLEALSLEPMEKTGNWNPFQVFTHCSQSVEYSMTGYPQNKSQLFQKSAGQLAFATFSARGSMSHSLDEVIPGAPPLAERGDAKLALDRLINALLDFNAYSGELSPHFAFGTLGKHDYAVAHSLHINNHLEEFQS